jgi:hypothetical protein
MAESGTGTRNEAIMLTTKKTSDPAANCHGTHSGLRMMLGNSKVNAPTIAKSETVTKLAPGRTMAVIGAKNMPTITRHMPRRSSPSVNSRSIISTKPPARLASSVPLTPSGTRSSSAPMVKAYGRPRLPSGGGPGVLSISRSASG